MKTDSGICVRVCFMWVTLTFPLRPPLHLIHIQESTQLISVWWWPSTRCPLWKPSPRGDSVCSSSPHRWFHPPRWSAGVRKLVIFLTPRQKVVVALMPCPSSCVVYPTSPRSSPHSSRACFIISRHHKGEYGPVRPRPHHFYYSVLLELFYLSILVLLPCLIW